MDDDVTDTLAPKSEQLDAVELAAGPRTFTVEKTIVKKGAEQPVSVYFVGFPRPWRPGVTMRRVLAFCWGERSSGWAGKSLTLFRDAEVGYGGKAVGGSRISHMSHIDGPTDVPVLLSQGRPGMYHVEPLANVPDSPKPPTEAAIATCTDKTLLRSWWSAFPAQQAAIKARVDELDADAAEGGEQA